MHLGKKIMDTRNEVYFPITYYKLLGKAVRTVRNS